MTSSLRTDCSCSIWSSSPVLAKGCLWSKSKLRRCNNVSRPICGISLSSFLSCLCPPNDISCKASLVRFWVPRSTSINQVYSSFFGLHFTQERQEIIALPSKPWHCAWVCSFTGIQTISQASSVIFWRSYRCMRQCKISRNLVTEEMTTEKHSWDRSRFQVFERQFSSHAPIAVDACNAKHCQIDGSFSLIDSAFSNVSSTSLMQSCMGLHDLFWQEVW